MSLCTQLYILVLSSCRKGSSKDNQINMKVIYTRIFPETSRSFRTLSILNSLWDVFPYYMTTLLRKTLTVTAAKVYGYLKEINHPPSILTAQQWVSLSGRLLWDTTLNLYQSFEWGMQRIEQGVRSLQKE